MSWIDQANKWGIFVRFLIGTLAAILAVLVTASLALRDITNLEARTIVIADSLGRISSAIVADRRRTDQLTQLVAGLARMRCREQPDRALDAGIPCSELSTPFPRSQ